MASLYHEGRQTFTELVPDGGARLDALFHTVPALGELAVGVVYGHLHARLASGLAPGEMTEVLLQASAFAGFPRAVSAAEQLNRLFDESGLASPPAPTPREIALEFCEQVRGGHAPMPVSAAVKRLLKHARQLALQASSAHAVIVECFEDEPSPRALLRLEVQGEQVVSVTLFKAH
jgi:4-carboxymuconolactone decarboxylase